MSDLHCELYKLTLIMCGFTCHTLLFDLVKLCYHLCPVTHLTRHTACSQSASGRAPISLSGTLGSLTDCCMVIACNLSPCHPVTSQASSLSALCHPVTSQASSLSAHCHPVTSQASSLSALCHPVTSQASSLSAHSVVVYR